MCHQVTANQSLINIIQSPRLIIRQATTHLLQVRTKIILNQGPIVHRNRVVHQLIALRVIALPNRAAVAVILHQKVQVRPATARRDQVAAAAAAATAAILRRGQAQVQAQVRVQVQVRVQEVLAGTGKI